MPEVMRVAPDAAAFSNAGRSCAWVRFGMSAAPV